MRGSGDAPASDGEPVRPRAGAEHREAERRPHRARGAGRSGGERRARAGEAWRRSGDRRAGRRREPSTAPPRAPRPPRRRAEHDLAARRAHVVGERPRDRGEVDDRGLRRVQRGDARGVRLDRADPRRVEPAQTRHAVRLAAPRRARRAPAARRRRAPRSACRSARTASPRASQYAASSRTPSTQSRALSDPARSRCRRARRRSCGPSGARPTRSSRSSTTTRRRGSRAASSRATASPTIPPPTTAKSGSAMDHLAVDDREADRHVGQLVGRAVDRVGGEPGEVGAHPGRDAAARRAPRRAPAPPRSCSPRAPPARSAPGRAGTARARGCPGARRSRAQARPGRGSAVTTGQSEPSARIAPLRRRSAQRKPRRDLLRLQVVAPRVRAGLVEPRRVQRLHRGRDALGREARQLGVAQRLDVLDPVRRDGVRAPASR